MVQVKIDKNVPVPFAWASLFEQMEVGDSFFVTGGKDTQSASQAMERMRRRSPEKIFISRSVKEAGIPGRRFWRTY